jgi:hypothetical protein
MRDEGASTDDRPKDRCRHSTREMAPIDAGRPALGKVPTTSPFNVLPPFIYHTRGAT